MKDINKEKDYKNKKIPKEFWWGIVPGLGTGSVFGGVIPIIISIGVWTFIAKKCLDAEDKNWRTAFWVVAIVVFIGGSFLAGIRMNSELLY